MSRSRHQKKGRHHYDKEPREYLRVFDRSRRFHLGRAVQRGDFERVPVRIEARWS